MVYGVKKLELGLSILDSPCLNVEHVVIYSEMLATRLFWRIRYRLKHSTLIMERHTASARIPFTFAFHVSLLSLIYT